MIPRFVRRRIAAILEGYLWLWRAAQTHSSSRLTGAVRFLGCAIGDVFMLGVWCAATPFTHPVQRDRVALPILALLVVALLPLDAPDAASAAPTSVVSVPEHVGSACGGALTLGAIANPGDELLAFEACADAFATVNPECIECSVEPSTRGLRLPAYPRLELSI